MKLTTATSLACLLGVAVAVPVLKDPAKGLADVKNFDIKELPKWQGRPESVQPTGETEEKRNTRFNAPLGESRDYAPGDGRAYKRNDEGNGNGNDGSYHPPGRDHSNYGGNDEGGPD